LLSSDLDLPYGTLIDYNCLRFQIEFNFRDAEQYWGKMPEPVLLAQIYDQVATLGSIHATKLVLNSS